MSGVIEKMAEHYFDNNFTYLKVKTVMKVFSSVCRELLVCSREGSMPKFLSGVHTTLKTPVLAVVFEVEQLVDFPSSSARIFSYLLPGSFGRCPDTHRKHRDVCGCLQCPGVGDLWCSFLWTDSDASSRARQTKAFPGENNLYLMSL